MTNFSDAKLDTLWGSDAALQEEKPGMSVSDALALRDLHPGRFPLTDLEDGDFLMASLAVWTAAHDGIPLMIVVAHKRSFMSVVI